MKKITWKNSKKVLAVIMAAAMVSAGCAGCGSKVSDKDENGRTTITVGGWPQKEGSSLDAMEERKAKFEESNPDVAIIPDSWTFDLKSFYAKAAGNQLPNIYGAYFTEVKQLIESGYCADLTDALKKYDVYDKFNENVMKAISKDGKVYVFPTYAYILGVAYNVDMFEAAGFMEADGTPKQPKDWDELIEMAVKIKEVTGKPGLVLPTMNNAGGWQFTPIAWSFGAEFVEKNEDGTWTAKLDSPEVIKALQWYKDLKWKYDIIPSNTLIDNGEAQKALATGGAAMTVTAADVAGKIVSYGMQPEQLGMLAMPAGPARHVTLMGGGMNAISSSATPDQVDAGVRWLMTAVNPNATEEFKSTTTNDINLEIEKNVLMTIHPFSVWNSDAETVKFVNNMRDEKANANVNHVRLYNEFIDDMGECELHAEVEVCAQELYGILDKCIQEVLTDENADCEAIMKKANAEYQADYLDNIDY